MKQIEYFLKSVADPQTRILIFPVTGSIDWISCQWMMVQSGYQSATCQNLTKVSTSSVETSWCSGQSPVPS